MPVKNNSYNKKNIDNNFYKYYNKLKNNKVKR